MHEEQITLVAKVLEEWNPLGDAANTVDGLDGYRYEAIDIISTVADGPLIPRERIRTELFRVIAYCDAKGNLELVGPEIGGSELSMAGKAFWP